MAGRSKKVRNIQSYVNHIDNNTFSGPMKSGTAPSIGKTRNYWHNYLVRCNQDPNAVKKSYANMVFLNINPAQTPVPEGFKQTTNYNYSYNAPPGVSFYDANVKFDNHYYRPYLPNASNANYLRPIVANRPNANYVIPTIGHMR